MKTKKKEKLKKHKNSNRFATTHSQSLLPIPNDGLNFTVCGARYKTRPGLTYHYTHSHKEKSQDDEASLEGAPSSPSMQRDKAPPNVMTMSKENPMGPGPVPGPGTGPPMPMNPGPMHMPPHPAEPSAQGSGGWGKFQDSYLTFLNASPGMYFHLGIFD